MNREAEGAEVVNFAANTLPVAAFTAHGQMIGDRTPHDNGAGAAGDRDHPQKR
jgi:hypothetical protein